ncbi:serine hydrolase domain-containing protein [Paraglaciecola sp. 2405UD69-4]|uniref:serine hydrolase domain-containing protein n=1 Tax=Paraglaciecola sp. 2405UD69-4 TaxID=3391836 RepID=UPI0039C924D2
MLKKRFGITFGVILLITWLTWPVYQFYAHKGDVPFTPWGWTEIPNQAPKSQIVNSPIYDGVAKSSLDLLDKHREKINAPGISAAVSIGGKIVWVGTAGWADLSKDEPVTSKTLFRVGSTSKAITATGLARLIDTKKIDLEKPISQYHRSLPNASWRNIKVKHLASHSSGLTHYKQFEDKRGLYKSITLNTYYNDVNDALGLFDGTKLMFDPGSQFSYSSYGTVLLSAVMQEAAQLPFLELMQQQVFTPLNLLDIGAEGQFLDNGTLAKFYWNDGGKSPRVREWRDVDLSHRLAGGGFVATSTALVKLGNSYFDDQFISRPTKRLLWTPQLLSNGEVNPQNYAIGWRVSELNRKGRSIKFMHHGGVSRGAQSLLIVIPEYKFSIAININAKTQEFHTFSTIWKALALTFIDTYEQANADLGS